MLNIPQSRETVLMTGGLIFADFHKDVCSIKFRKYELNFFRGKGEVNPKEFRFPVIVAKRRLATRCFQILLVTGILGRATRSIGMVPRPETPPPKKFSQVSIWQTRTTMEVKYLHNSPTNLPPYQQSQQQKESRWQLDWNKPTGLWGNNQKPHHPFFWV